MGQPITEILASSEVASEQSSRCSVCGYRQRYGDRKWCRPCILAWQRAEPERTTRYANCLYDLCSLEEAIPERYEQARMEHLPDAVREAAEGLADDKGLFLWGAPGVGKTYSLCAVARWLYYRGWDVKRISFEMLCLQVRACFGSGRDELGVLRPFLDVDKLILEDVGTTVAIGKAESDFNLRTFLVLLDTRLEHCRATSITSNKSVEELGKSFDQRIASRLQQACVVMKLEGKDRRAVQ